MLTVGFDLDMTLIDPRPGMVRAFEVLGARTGIPLDGESFANNLGPPLQDEFRRYVTDEDQVTYLVTEFRALYPEIVIPRTVALPGAVESVAAVRELGGRVVVVTGKYAPNAALHLSALGIEVDDLVGELWSVAKAEALREFGAQVYVGDHIGDVVGARAADAVAVTVPSGACDAAQLAEAGADAVLVDLTEFPAWLREWETNRHGLDLHYERRSLDRQNAP
ncbi:HAD family hydrolase [Allokutzneria oryzae]|uniref:HAD family hydrolase n=1 Tax=Allokutzneria oryzae TaxID=1378989 RepID=A0ABV6A8Z6_9PSEU